jgi:release factor glutamine methyltransferase
MNTTEQSDISQPADTTGALVASGTATLAAAGVPTARLDAEVLLAHACGTDRAGLYAHLSSVVSSDCRSRFDTLVLRRQRREPLQHIVGHQEFWSLDFVVTPDVLIPRPETEMLVELAVAILPEASFAFPLPQEAVDHREPHPSRRSQRKGPPQGGRKLVLEHNNRTARPEEPPPEQARSSRAVSKGSGGVSKGARRKESTVPLGGGRGDAALRLCDLGTGSGCLAVTLARELPLVQVWALDISEAALDVARFNARRHGVAERVHFLPSDGFSAVNGLRFDAIVCNPPYVPSCELQRAQPEIAWEPRSALDGGVTGLAVIRRVVAEAPRYLEDGGWLLMEMGADQRAAVEQLARAAGFSSVSVRTDYAGLPRALVVQR